jgi:flagellar biosynthetic protein FliR
MNEFLKLLEFVLKTFEVGNSPQTFLVLFGLAFARIISFLTIVPFFGGQAVPSRVKVATATALVIIVYPSLAAGLPTDGQPLPFGPLGFIALLAKEAFVGFTLGYIASSVFEAIQSAGRIIDGQRGSTMAELYAPQVQARVSELGQFKLQLGIVIFLAIGAHHLFLRALLESFVYIPATTFPHIESGWSSTTALITQLSAMMFSFGVQLAIAPVMALLLTDLFFGIVNRVAPQINVFFLSMPVKMVIGLLVVALALPFLKEQFIFYFQQAFNAFELAIRMLSPLTS